jgi:hypothetical protein
MFVAVFKKARHGLTFSEPEQSIYEISGFRAVKIYIVVSWINTHCSLVVGYQCL